MLYDKQYMIIVLLRVTLPCVRVHLGTNTSIVLKVTI